MSPLVVASVSLLAVLAMMFAESRISRRHERRLRDAGAIEPPGDVYATMQWAYPVAFLAMGVEGAMFGPEPGFTTLVGVLLMCASKALKCWAISSLGPRWTFRVLVLPGAPLVAHGPYAVVRHPNYIAVVGELVSMALLVHARVTGPLATLLFGLLLRRRIRVENQALRHRTCS
ncbi:MAG: isoprenylcysteine carboxylmethyltransferase family protein [Vicinamibacterales bacterium]